MKRSTERFLTTHTGSLPRPDDLIRMMYAKEEGVPVEPAALAAHVRAAVAEVVKKQAAAGIDIVNDGEMSKPSYATYVKDRLDGLRRHRQHLRLSGPRRVSRISPGACSAIPAARAARRRHATHRSACAMPRAARTDVENLKSALAGVQAGEAFMSAASPGVISLFFRNDHYKDQETYLFAIADAMRHEYETVANAGIVLQIDCPDLAMGRHIQYADLSLPEFRKRAALHVEALNHALANIPPEQAAHASVLGQLRGPAPLRRAARRHHRHRVHGAARRDLVRGRQSAPRARMEAVRTRQAARRAKC